MLGKHFGALQFDALRKRFRKSQTGSPEKLKNGLSYSLMGWKLSLYNHHSLDGKNSAI